MALRTCRRSFFFQAEDGIRDLTVTGVQTCALPISRTARPSQMLAAALPRGHAAQDVRAVRDHLPGVEGALVPGKALDNDARLLVEQDAHAGFVVGADRRAATTFSAASESVSAVRIGRPLSVRMRRPSSTLVPASRTTSGTETCTSRTA